MSTAIHIREVVKTFESARGRATAVDRVSLEIEPGELFFLLGPSGCGKTTLLRMIAGFIDPTSGVIALNGKDITHAPPNKRNTGMVFQSYALWPHMTVEQNVGFGLQVRRVAKDERARRVAEALDAVHMGDFAKRRPTELSGGQQQRVALARALVIRPAVLLLDEPLSNLDAKLRIELRSQIRTICKGSGITSMYVTHDQKEALSMADRVAIMRQGRVEQVGAPRELYRRPATRFVAEFLGETNFIEGEVGPAAGECLELKTAAGTLRTARIGAAAGSRVVCSIRPESVKLTGPSHAGAIRARRVDTVYLGEVAQHTLELPGGVRLRASELNPSLAARDDVGVVIEPEDVVIVAP